jgi:hypothetical protein
MEKKKKKKEGEKCQKKKKKKKKKEKRKCPVARSYGSIFSIEVPTSHVTLAVSS